MDLMGFEIGEIKRKGWLEHAPPKINVLPPTPTPNRITT